MPDLKARDATTVWKLAMDIGNIFQGCQLENNSQDAVLPEKEPGQRQASSWIDGA